MLRLLLLLLLTALSAAVAMLFLLLLQTHAMQQQPERAGQAVTLQLQRLNLLAALAAARLTAATEAVAT